MAENASAKFGGEAILPLHYFRLLRQRGVDAHLVVNVRTGGELEQLLPAERDRMHFVPDTRAHRWLNSLGQRLPGSVNYFSTGLLMRLISAWYARRIVRRLVAERGVQIVHQPTPVSPKEASLIYNVGAPVVIGPMNGGINFPPGFGNFERGWVRAFVGGGRMVSHALHWLIPGKRRAQTLLVANPRTAAALPGGLRGKVQMLVENGVDLALWKSRHGVAGSSDVVADAEEAGAVGFVFSGRLVDWKGVQFLIEAFAIVHRELPGSSLQILGSGPMRSVLEAQVAATGLGDSVAFAGWTSQPQCAAILAAADVFVLPSLYECGGAVVLEAMACGLPVIATHWGGPADYLDSTCGILVDPQSPQQFPIRLAEAMMRLGRDPTLRRTMGAAGRTRVEQHFDWQRKIDTILQVYAETRSRWLAGKVGAARSGDSPPASAGV